MARETGPITDYRDVAVAVVKIEVKKDQAVRITYRFSNDTAEPVFFLDRNPDVVFEDDSGEILTFRHSLAQEPPPFMGFPNQKFFLVKPGEARHKTYTLRHPGVVLCDGTRVRAGFGWGNCVDSVKSAQGRTGYQQIVQWQTLVESDPVTYHASNLPPALVGSHPGV